MKNKIFSLASQDELTPMSMNENGIFEGGFSILKQVKCMKFTEGY